MYREKSERSRSRDKKTLPQVLQQPVPRKFIGSGLVVVCSMPDVVGCLLLALPFKEA